MNITSTEKQNQLVRSDIHYDAVWNQIYGSYPYFVTSVDISGLYDSLSGQKDGEAFRAAQAWASYTYDALGRIISEKDALGTTLHEYFPKKEKITNALWDVMEVENDAYWKIVLVREFLGTSPKETKYSYNALGNITWMVDAQWNIRAWYYDWFGRLAKAEDMHDPTDVTFASKQYQYNNLGKITRYTTPSWEYITYNYDDLGRVTGETWSGISRTYTYDVGSRSLGTLWMVQNSWSLVTYNYDPLGRKTWEMRDFVSKSYNIAYKYNIQNALVELTYPDNGKTTYNYLSGYLDSINYRSYSWTLYNIIKDITYSPNGTMKTQKYGNGITRDTIRDPNYNHRISRVTIASWATTYLDTQYSYDAINNIVWASVDWLDPIRKTITYTYDDLARLTNSFYNYAVWWYNRIQNQSYSYTYDDIWNILNMSSVGNYSYSEDGYTNPHAVTSAWDLSYGYDIAGNMTSRTNSGDTINFRYSLYGELLGADHAWESTNYLYDHTNRRIVKYNSGILEHHVIDGYEVEYETWSLTTMSWSVPFTLTTRLTHIMFWDEKIATLQSQSENIDNIKTDQLVYHHSDHLNSSTFDFSQTGSLLQATDYQPFGKTITYAVTSARVPGKKWWYQNKYLFANKQLDNETDLQYFEKRYYDPRIGRFTTEDPVFWEVSLTKRPNQYFTDPEQWNSYSYVRNNPINFTDPTGEAMGWDVSLPWADIATGLISIGTTIVRWYYLMVNFFIVEWPYIVSTTAATTAATQPLIDAASTQWEAWPTAPTWPSGKPPDKQPKDDKWWDQGNNWKKDSKSDKPKSQYKEPKPWLSWKEWAKDAPSYAKWQRPYINESWKDFSKRIMDNQFWKWNYKTWPGTDFNKIQKYWDRNFQNPPKSN